MAPALVLAVLLAATAVATTTINDVTGLNPMTVERVVVPRSAGEVAHLVRSHRGPICIGGGRYSQGGQMGTPGCLFLDMRELNRIVSLSVPYRTLTVEAGATWRQVQEALDPHELSVRIMQSYANFTVGGALSVNCHGRYVGQGPIIRSVRSIKVVTADGTTVDASPGRRPELFYGAIGGYGGLGVIVEATLELADNRKLLRRSTVMPLSEYPAYFTREVAGKEDAVIHNGDLYPPAYDTVRATTYSVTQDPVTVPERLRPFRGPSFFNRVVMNLLADFPGGLWLRRRLFDPIRMRGEPVVWRNYEAGYDAASLEPFSREYTTYVLQEYFVPIDKLEPFATAMGAVFRKHGVKVLNVSIRHALADPGSLLAWARQDVFALVVYYRQGTSQGDRLAVGAWTRELIDAVLAQSGTYYLPYQPHATPEQFHRAYPRAKEFFALKARVDPAYRFRNSLWEKYRL